MAEVLVPKYQLISPYQSRERILLSGPTKVGKSNAVISIAKYTPSSTVHVIDNDNAYVAALERSSNPPSNIQVHDVEDYEETIEAIREVRDWIKQDEDVRRDDWIAVDLFSGTWDDVQSSFVEEIFDTTMDSYMMAKRKALQGRREDATKNAKPGDKASAGGGGALGVFEQDTDWTTINHVYRQLQATLRRFPCHVIACTEVDEIDTRPGRKNDKEMMKLYGAYGVKPRGQKRSPHLFHTLLMMTKMSSGENAQYVMTSIGDRGDRADLDEDEVGEFAVSYLQGIAGWKPKMMKKEVAVNGSTSESS